MSHVKVGPRHQITIPQEVREAAGIKAGDLVEIAIQRGRVVITPTQVIPRPMVAHLSCQQQEILLSARRKIDAIQGDMSNATGLTPAEADTAVRAGLIAPDQRWWWLEEWQAGERAAERDEREGRYTEYDSPQGFLQSLDSSSSGESAKKAISGGICQAASRTPAAGQEAARFVFPESPASFPANAEFVASDRRSYFFKFIFEALFRMPQIVILLHPQPQAGSIPREFADSERHLGGDRVRTGQNTVKLLTRNSELSRRRTDRKP